MPLIPRACGNISCAFQTERGHLSQLQDRRRMVSVMGSLKSKHESRGPQQESLFLGVIALEIQPRVQISLLGIGNNAKDDIQPLGSPKPPRSRNRPVLTHFSINQFILVCRNDYLVSFFPQSNYGERLPFFFFFQIEHLSILKTTSSL